MSFNIKRTLASGVVGAASGATNAGILGQQLTIGTTTIQYSTVVEAVGLVGGAALQMLMPYAMPDIVDGVVDGSIALLAKRGTELALRGSKTLAAPMYGGGQANPLLGAGAAAAQFSGSRAAIGGIGRMRHVDVA
ncbi:MAG: hypothetical protein C4534_08300 [Gaiellales bacterium]|nr:MAG: hypothetical protein C4534_08300 [Gaiellales bacterium]